MEKYNKVLVVSKSNDCSNKKEYFIIDNNFCITLHNGQVFSSDNGNAMTGPLGYYIDFEANITYSKHDILIQDFLRSNNSYWYIIDDVAYYGNYKAIEIATSEFVYKDNKVIINDKYTIDIEDINTLSKFVSEIDENIINGYGYKDYGYKDDTSFMFRTKNITIDLTPNSDIIYFNNISFYQHYPFLYNDKDFEDNMINTNFNIVCKKNTGYNFCVNNLNIDPKLIKVINRC